MKKNQPTPGKIPAKDTHPSGSSLKRKPSASIVILVFLGLSLIISMSIAGYLATQNNLLRNQVSQELLSIPTVTANPTSNIKLEATVTPPKKQATTGKPLPQSLITEQVITDWKTYEDPKYGFKFDNPGQYILEIGAGHDGVRLYDLLTYQDVKEPYLRSSLFINIAAYENPEHLSSVDWFEKYVVRDSVNPIEHYEILQVDSINAVKYYWSEAGGGYTTILADGNYVVLLIDTGISQQDFKRLISTLSVP